MCWFSLCGGLAYASVGPEPAVCFAYTMQPNGNSIQWFLKYSIYSQQDNHWYGILYTMAWLGALSQWRTTSNHTNAFQTVQPRSSVIRYLMLRLTPALHAPSICSHQCIFSLLSWCSKSCSEQLMKRGLARMFSSQTQWFCISQRIG